MFSVNPTKMKNEKILKLTLEGYGYNLEKFIFPADELIMAISEAMDRARLDQAGEAIKRIQERTKRVGSFYANEETTYNLIKKLNPY
jgi:hypothetical protein